MSGAERAPLVLGTAGHIDHGKTALVGALTGRQTDRLPEERARGISIALGYASMVLPGGRRLSVIDVPGHERFVRTMVAGASGIDLFLLCVAADDGVMPQTREHLAVLRQLGVAHGVVAVTKADLGEPELAAEEVSELVPGIETVPVSALDGTGLEDLRSALDRVADRLPGRAASGDGGGPARLHVDRSFTLRGIGTVVTGTLWSGELRPGDPVTVLPRALAARVRSVQVHDEPVEVGRAGQRVALNLAGVGWRELGRGDVVSGPGSVLRATYLIDVRAALEPGAAPLPRGSRVHVHHGTREAPARVVPLEGDELRAAGGGYVQLRLEAPLVPAAGDRVILRRVAPPDTVGGGVVVDPAPRKHAGRPEVVARLQALERGDPVHDPPAEPRARPQRLGADEPSLDDAALRLAVLLRSDGRTPRTDAELAAAVELAPRDVATRLSRLARAGQAVRVGANLHFSPDALEELRAAVIALCERDGQVTIASVRDELDTSRKYAQAVLEHLDATRVTVRRGDAHVLRRRGRTSSPA